MVLDGGNPLFPPRRFGMDPMRKLAMTALALAFLAAVSFPAMACSPGMMAVCGTNSPCPSQNRPCGTTVKGEAHPALPPEPQARFAAHPYAFLDQTTHLPETPPPRPRA